MDALSFRADGSEYVVTSAADAAQSIARSGFVWLKGVLPVELLREAAATVDRQGVEAFAVGGEYRHLVVPRLEGPLLDDRLLGCDPIWEVAEAVLGPHRMISAAGVVISPPGAKQQPLHRDSRVPLGNACLQIAFPLIATPDTCGRTRFWPESLHRAEYTDLDGITSVEPHVVPGDALIWDFRTTHCGMPNASDLKRPLFYISATTDWARDPNLDERLIPPFSVDLEGFLSASTRVRELLRSAGGMLVHSRIEISEELSAIVFDDPREKAYVDRLAKFASCTFRQAIVAGLEVPLEAMGCAEILHTLLRRGVLRCPAESRQVYT